MVKGIHAMMSSNGNMMVKGIHAVIISNGNTDLMNYEWILIYTQRIMVDMIVLKP